MKLEIACTLLAILLLLCACAQPLLPTGTEAPTTDQKTALTTIRMTDPTVPPATYEYHYYFGMDTRLCLLDETQKAELAACSTEEARAGTYPTFADPYPSDHGGPEYEIDEALREQERQAAARFLRECIGTTEEALQFETVGAQWQDQVVYACDALMLSAGPDYMTLSRFGGLSEELTPETVLAEPMVRAALQWLEIDTPRACCAEVPDNDGTLLSRTVTISQQDDDPLQQLLNDTFRSVTVRREEPDGGVTVSFPYGTPERDGEVAVALTDAQLEAFLARFFPGDAPEEYYARIVYSPRVEVGRYVPCCRIYIPEPDCPPVDGKTVCTVSELDLAFILADAG